MAHFKNIRLSWFQYFQHGVETGRINFEVLSSTFAGFKKEKRKFCFICGPNEMIKSVKLDLIKLGLDEKAIFYELWW